MHHSKLIVSIVLFLLPLCLLAEEAWIDLTENYIKNAGYDNNSADYWEGTALGFVGPLSNAEHYQKNYDTYQVLTGLTPGKYRVSLQAYYRAGESGSDYNHFMYDGDSYRHAQLYATSSVDDYSTPICYASSAAQSQSLGGATSTVGDWGNTLYIPNNMEAAHYWFEAGYYDNSVECEVGDDGQLRIGIRKSTTLSGDWTCIDNWRIEQWATFKKITTVYFLPSTMKMYVGDVVQLTPHVIPSDATIQKYIWASSDETVATVDQKGVVTCKKSGTVNITAQTTDGSNKTARCRITVEGGMVEVGSVIINEIMPANIDLFVDPSWNYGGFVELYNPTLTTATMGGCYVSDDPENLLKWRMPLAVGNMSAKGYFTIWFDNNDKYAPTQCPFKLDVDGGTIYISNSAGTLLASQDYPPAYRRCSYARVTDGADEWEWTGTPTPGATNNGSRFASEQLESPVADKKGQVFIGTLQVMVGIPDGATLRYTTDGSVPTLSNGFTSYTGVFSITQSVAYRFRLFKDGYLPSDVVTHSYIYNDKNFNIPILSVVTDRSNLYGADYGIFVQGNGHGIRGRGQSVKSNWNMDWERPVSMEYFADADEVSFAQEVNMSPCGGWSRAWTPHSFKLKANKVYGLKYMPYAFFDDKPYIKNKSLQVRNGGNDTSCRIIDPALQEIVSRSGLNVDGQAYQPAFVYINGEPYSVLNIREPNNKHFAYANRGLDDDEQDQFEYSPDSGYVQMEGTREAFERLYELSANAADANVYEQIKQLLDIDEFINYMAVEMYLGSSDWLNNSNNTKAYRPRIEGGKFRFVLFDLDAYGGTNEFAEVENTNWQTLDKLYDCDVSAYYKEIELTTIWLNLLNNKSFRKQFIDSFCLVTGSVFNPDRCRAIVNELADRAYTAMRQMGGSPWNSANGIINAMSASRQNTMINRLKGYNRMKLGNVNSVNCSLSANIEEARLTVNGLPVPTNTFSGQLFPPVTVKSQAPAGYKFMGWASEGSTIDQEIITTTDNWLFYDKGSLDGRKWYNPTYSTSAWNEGQSPLGYATGSTWTDYNTSLNWGTDKNNKRTTFYFRKNITLDKKPSSGETMSLSFSVDDGCIVYVNGKEAGRYNMPSGTVTYSTFASTYGDQFSYPQTMELDASLFVAGDNLIAVEVHNNDKVSSDIHWEASLIYSTLADGEMLTTDEEFVLPASGNVKIVAMYTPLTDEELANRRMAPVRINEISASNSMYINDYFDKSDWVELYNTTDETIDLAGMYLSDNPDKPQKYQFGDDGISTLIEPHGYRIVWCDKAEPVSQLHASFKLENAAASVTLTAADGSWSDVLEYTAHDGELTVGRYPDGNDSIYVMCTPTIGKSNTVSTCDSIVPQSAVEIIPGDVNGDGFVNVLDISMLAAYILGNNPESFILPAADFDADGMVNVADISAIAGFILDGTEGAYSHVARANARTDVDEEAEQINQSELTDETDAVASELER